MNSRGAIEIVLGLLALQAGIIRDRLFVALVIMAIVTSMMSGPAIRLILRLGKKRTLLDAISSKLFTRELQAFSSSKPYIGFRPALKLGLNTSEVEAAVWERKKSCHRRRAVSPLTPVSGISKPVAVGISGVGSISTRTISCTRNISDPYSIDAPDTRLEITQSWPSFSRNYGMTERCLK
jgi:hypothetical protein